MMGPLGRVSLVSGAFPALLAVLAFGALLATLLRCEPRWWGRVTALAVASLALVFVTGQLAGVEHRVGSSFPRSFFAWAALPVFAGAVAALGWRGARTWRRAVSVAAALLLLVFGADTIDVHYAYLPTLGDALGQPLRDSVKLTVVRAGHAASPPPMPPHGALVSVAIPGVVSGFRARGAEVWLPPAYLASPSRQWPAVMLLGGVPGTPEDMVRAGGVAQIGDAYAAQHGGVAPVLVMPDQNGAFFNDTECVDGPRGRVDTYLMVDVRRFVQQNYDAALDGSRWAIAGFSEGGTCAVTLAVRHPDAFGAFVGIGGDSMPTASVDGSRLRTIRRLYGGDQREWAAHDPVWLLAHQPVNHGLAAYFAAGTQDRRASRAAARLGFATKRAGMPTTVESIPGGHSWSLAQRVLRDLLPVIDTRLLAARPEMITVHGTEGQGCSRDGRREWHRARIGCRVRAT